jgi:hypothetical protein
VKKKKKAKHKHIRNAAPRAPRAAKPGDETTTHRLGYTAAGAAGSALLGAFLARQGWAPKTVSGALAAVGAGLAWKGEGSTVRSVGAGAMSGAGAQLALMVLADREEAKKPATVAATTGASTSKRLANAETPPPGAVEAAFYRARDRLAMSAAEQEETT